ncbi:TolC family protein [Acetobacter sp. AN02]|uniref:TolC family protein n=1 Tax=Acetobacter sp. AN02 TaxID=2894186 RepID=UPI002434379A|nr:TolC family protein [Acetobacter sp. AN02]MDG6094744.1 TolC family protein [Acetobacter sp. AN02]
MTHRSIAATLLLLTLSGCATDALRSAPQRPDQPWHPDVSDKGEILPGRAQGRQSLALPPGFVLPSNSNISPRLPHPDIAPGHAYQLAEIIDMAEESSPVTRTAWNAARDAALAVGITRASYLPTLTASVVGGYTRSRNSLNSASLSDVGQAGTVSTGNLGNSGWTSGTGEVQTLGLQWLLFDFGEREARISMAQQTQIASNVLFTGAHQKVIYDVTLAYYAHAAAVARLKLTRDALVNSRKVAAAAEARLKQDQATVQEVAQARATVAQNELRVVEGEGSVRDTYLSLMTAAGLSPTTQFDIAPVTGRTIRVEDATLTDDMIRKAVSRRPDVLAAYASARSAEEGVRAAKSAFLPKIFATGNVSYSTGNLALSSLPGAGQNSSPTLNVSSNAFSSIILGGITIPVFDGGLRAALLSRARNSEDNAKATLRQTQDESVRQVVAAQNALHTASAAYKATTAAVKASQISFNAALTACQSGAGSVTQAILAQSVLLNTTIQQSDTYHAALTAAASVAFATGALGQAPDTSGIPEYSPEELPTEGQ